MSQDETYFDHLFFKLTGLSTDGQSVIAAVDSRFYKPFFDRLLSRTPGIRIPFVAALLALVAIKRHKRRDCSWKILGRKRYKPLTKPVQTDR